MRTKGYGPTKDLLRGVDTTKQLVIETDLHPADAEMQRYVLSLTSPDVNVHSPQNSETSAVDGTGSFKQDGMAAIAPEQLASVANAIVSQVREHLEVGNYVSEAAHDDRSKGVVNAVANCLKEEMERLYVSMHSHEASFARLLQENTDVICARVADVIQPMSLSSSAKAKKEEKQRLSRLTQGVVAAVTNLEGSLKTTLETTLAASSKAMDPVVEDMRAHLVEVIEQSSREQQENLVNAFRDMLEMVFTSQHVSQGAVNPDAIQEAVRGAMSRVVEESQNKVRELLGAVRSQSLESETAAESGDRSALEGLLASYGERLEEMRVSAAGLVDLKELLMEVHNYQQVNETAIHEVKESVKKLKKELMGALRDATFSVSADVASDSSADQLGEYSKKLDVLADRVTSTVQQQLTMQFSDVKELPKRLQALEKVIRKKQKLDLTSLQVVEMDDRLLVTMAQSISDSILASLPTREELASPAPLFTKSELAEAVASVLYPKLDELASATATIHTAALQAAKRSKVAAGVQAEESATLFGEQQLVTLAQTITDGLRDAVQKTASDQRATDALSEEDGVRTVVKRLEGLKESILATLREEMERTHEVDLTPFQTYVDDVFKELKDVLSKQQDTTQDKVASVAETLLERLNKQQMLLQEVRDKQRSSDTEVKSPAFTAGDLETLNSKLLQEVRKAVTDELTSLMSSLNAGQGEIRSATGKLPPTLEEKLSEIKVSLSEGKKAEQDSNALVQTTLQNVKASVDSISEKNNSATQLLESISNVVRDLEQRSTASEKQAKALRDQVATDLLKHFDPLQKEVREGKRHIEQLISSRLEHKEVASSVETMRTRLEEVSSLLKGVNSLLTSRSSERLQNANGEAIESRLETLLAETRRILSEIQEQRSARDKAASPSTDVSLTSGTLEAMEDRLSGRLQTLQGKLDEMTQLDVDAALPVDELLLPQVLKSKEGNRFLGEINALIEVLQKSRSAQVRQIQGRLIALRSLVLEANLDEPEGRNREKLLKALEENRLKLKADVAGAEAALVGEMNNTVGRSLERFLKSIEESTASSTKALGQQLQRDLSAENERLKTEQQQVAQQLHDRLNKLEKSLEHHTADLTTELQKGQKDWQNTLQQVVPRDIPIQVQGVVRDVCAEQLHSLQNQLDKQGTRGEESAAKLLSNVQQVSQDINQLGDLGAKMRAAVSGTSTEVIEELRRTHDSLAERFASQLSALATQKGAETTPSVAQYTSPDSTVVQRWFPQSFWWLFLLSCVIFASVMACAYFLFAAFLVAFVPLPATSLEELPSDDVFVSSKRPLLSRVVDHVRL